MELRLMIAYALIALIVLVGAIASAVWLRRRAARRLRMRGIKSQGGSTSR